MRRTRMPAGLFAVVATVFAGAAVMGGATPAAAADCPGTAIFETDGYTAGETMANWRGSRFNQNVPAGYQVFEVEYYAGVFPIKDRLALDASVAEGMRNLTRAITDFRADCPGSHLTLAGYSEGAVVAGNVLEGYARSGEIPRDQLNGVLYGNPRRPFGDGGRAGVAGGIETNLPSVLPGVTMQGPHDIQGIDVRDVCNENDGICNSLNPITNLQAFANGLHGYVSGDHGYDFDPVRDSGDGLTLIAQEPRIPYGPSLPLPVGTPWQIQQQLGGGDAGRQAMVVARDAVLPLLGQDTRTGLAGSPWYRLITVA